MRGWVQVGFGLSVAMAVLFGGHAYIWARLVRDTAPGPRGTWALTSLLVVLGLSIPATMIWVRTHAQQIWRPQLTAAYLWMGLFFILVCLLAGGDALQGVWRLWQRLHPQSLPEDPARRLFIARLVGGATQAAALGCGAVAVWTARYGLEVTQVPIRLPRWPKSMAGLKIAQISDLHIAPLLGADYVAKVVAECNRQAPDVVVITGDLVDGSVSQLWPQAELLGQLRAPQGVFFITGNHEYYSGVEAWLAALTSLGIRVLRNEHVTLRDPHGGAFDLVGVDDLAGRNMAPGHGPDLIAALAGRDPSRPSVLLAHQPRMIHQAAAHHIDLMLSGHTHGGQIWPFGYIVRLVQPYLSGWAQHGDTQIYVNRGTGYWGPPMRLGQRPELTVLTFQA